MAASAYLVLASQRSGSTLLVESLRATGVAGEPQEFFQYLPTTSQSPQPRQWFEDVDDESILRLLDPIDEGKPDLAPPEIWRDYIRTVGRTPNGIWGGKLMWNQTPLLLQRASGPAGPLRRRPAGGHPRRHRLRPGPGPRHRPDVVSQAVSFWRAVQTRVWRGRPDPRRDSAAEYHAGAIAHVVTHAAGAGEGLADTGSPRRASTPSGRLLSGVVAQPHPDRRHRARGAGPGSAAGTRAGVGAPGRSTLRRVGRPLPRRRRTGGPADMTVRRRLRHPARRRTAAAGGRGGAHHPRGGRRTGAARAAVLRRQGLHRAAPLGGEGFSAVAAAVPGDARRHRPQLRRGHRVPRPSGHRRRPQADRRRRFRSPSTAVGFPIPGPVPPATGSRPARCWTPWRRAASTPHSAAPAATRNARAPRSAS